MVTADLMTSVLARLTGTTVANLGQAGFSARQELVVLKRYALALNPKMIIWAFYESNDLIELDTYDSLMAGGDARSRLSPSVFDRSFSNNALAALYRVFWPCWPSSVAQLQFGLVRDSDGHPVRLHFGDPGDAIKPMSSHAPTLEKLTRILAEAHTLTSARGIQLVIAYIPDAFRVYQNLAEFPRNSRCLDWTVDDLPNGCATSSRGSLATSASWI